MKKIDSLIRNMEDWISGTLIIGGLAVMLLQVFLRYVLEYPTTWQDEVSRYLIVWGVLLGSSVALRDHVHIRIDILEQFLPKMAKKWVNVFANLIILMFLLFLIIYGFILVLHNFKTGQQTANGFSLWFIYTILPLSGMTMLLRTIGMIVVDIKR